jgi:hypothetical protein
VRCFAYFEQTTRFAKSGKGAILRRVDEVEASEVARMNIAAELRERAARYRRMTLQLADPQAVKVLIALAAEYDEAARELERGEVFPPPEGLTL